MPLVRLQLSQALEEVLPENMHGFRPNRNTESALVQMLEKIKAHKCQGKKVALLALDASAAFDLLSHSLILRTLEAIGAGPLMLNWTTDYLSGCLQYVDLNGFHSAIWSTDVGVGQGKRLSGDFFNLGCLSNAIWSVLSDLILYADDGGDGH